jgi:hypothetical protein
MIRATSPLTYAAAARRARIKLLQTLLRSLLILAIGVAATIAAAEQMSRKAATAEARSLAGELLFAPGSSSLLAEQRQVLDQLPTRRPLCLIVWAPQKKTPLALRVDRVGYVAQLLVRRSVTVLATDANPRPQEFDDAIPSEAVIWEAVECPGVPKPLRDTTLPQP